MTRKRLADLLREEQNKTPEESEAQSLPASTAARPARRAPTKADLEGTITELTAALAAALERAEGLQEKLEHTRERPAGPSALSSELEQVRREAELLAQSNTKLHEEVNRLSQENETLKHAKPSSTSAVPKPSSTSVLPKPFTRPMLHSQKVPPSEPARLPGEPPPAKDYPVWLL